MSSEKRNRREFLGRLAMSIAGTGAAGKLLEGSAKLIAAETGSMPYRTLGRSGERVSVIGLGGYHIGMQNTVKESVRIIRTAIDHGVTFMDNCWDYHNGESEARMGKALRDGYRQKVFLMTKIDGQVKEAAARQIEDSLRRLQTDHVDLLQFHEIIRPEDPDRIFSENGSIHAVMEARKAGKIRYIGFTGHKDPDIHLKMLHTAFAHSFTFDAVQMPLNIMDAHYHSFQKKVVPVLVEHGIGVLGMKPLANGIALESKTVTPLECLHYAMNLPTSVVITGMDSLDRVHQALEAARTFKPLTPEQVGALLRKTASAGESGKFEPFKNTHQFDGTYHNPQWLG